MHKKGLILTLVIIFVVTMLFQTLSFKPVMADSKNIITTVPTLPKDFSGIASTLMIREENTPFREGDRFRIILTPGVEWNLEDSGVFSGTVNHAVYQEAATYTKLNNRILEIVMNDLGNHTVDPEDRIEIPIDVAITDATGELKLVVDPLFSVLSGGEYTFAYVNQDPSGGGTPSGENRAPIPYDLTNPNWGMYLGINPSLGFNGGNLASDPDGDPLIISKTTMNNPNIVDLFVRNGALQIVPINVGNVTVTSEVYDGRGGRTNTTPINVTVKEPYLLGLTIKGNDSYNRYFPAPILRDIETTVGPDVSSITIKADARNPFFEIKINNELTPSGEFSNDIPLQQGLNVIPVTVTDLQGNSHDFPITINRTDSVCSGCSGGGGGGGGAAPAYPFNFSINGKASDSLTLSFGRDNSTYRYELFRNDQLINNVTTDKTTVFKDDQLQPNTIYSYELKAFDSQDKLIGIAQIVTSTTPIDECFIATAAYGSKFEPAVTLLRHFRDEHLLTNSIGQDFVKFYYTNSPPIAAFISENEVLKGIVRVLLSPVVAIVYLVMNPILLVLVSLLTLLSITLLRRRDRHILN